MIEKDLLKVKWRSGYKYIVDGKEISAEEYFRVDIDGLYVGAEEINENTEVKPVYKKGDLLKIQGKNGIVLDEEGKFNIISLEKLTVLDEYLSDIENNFYELRKLVGRLFLTDEFMELVNLLQLIYKNKLISDNLQEICNGIDNGNIDEILDIVHELLNAGDEEERKKIAEKHGL